jgi:arylsulfatase A-like enzyme
MYGVKWDNPKKGDNLGQMLETYDYDTFATGKWHLSDELFYKSFKSYENIFFGGMMSRKSKISYNKNGGNTILRDKYPGEIFTDSLISYIKTKQDKSKPYFGYIAYTEPHDPLRMINEFKTENKAIIPNNFKYKHSFSFGQEHHRDEKLMKRPLDKKKLLLNIKKYMTMMSYLDTQINKIIESLNTPTIIIFTTDNGICQGNHGLLGKQNLYQDSIHLPLFLWGYQLDISGVYNQNIYLHNIYHIIQDILDNYKNEEESKSINTILENVPSNDFITFRFKNEIYSVIHKNWKLIYYRNIKKWKMYNIKTNPNETVSLDIDKYNDIFILLKKHITKMIN